MSLRMRLFPYPETRRKRLDLEFFIYRSVPTFADIFLDKTGVNDG